MFYPLVKFDLSNSKQPSYPSCCCAEFYLLTRVHWVKEYKQSMIMNRAKQRREQDRHPEEIGASVFLTLHAIFSQYSKKIGHSLQSLKAS